MQPIPPEIERINKLLAEHFGLDTSTGRPLWRVVFSDDQFEKRLMPTTDEGFMLLHPEVREVPKYRQWIPHMWVLEQLVIVPDMNLTELAGLKLSYEPMFPFHDVNFFPTQPSFEACKFIIDNIHAKMGKPGARYKDNPDGNTSEESIEIRKNRIDKLVVEIFGNETDTTDHLSRQTGVVIDNTNALIKEN